MNHLSPVKTGLAVGKLLAVVHIIWVLLVALGWAQALANFSQWAHMASFPLVVGPFNITASITVILVATIIGYFIGYIFARIWNRLHHS